MQQQQYADGRSRQPGWDLTFSAPKSVSSLWATAPTGTRDKLQGLHDEAVREALSYLENTASFTRRGKGGESAERCGLAVATFQHGTSRTQDPQLHTHALVINVGAREDGTWGTVRSRDFYQHKMAAGALYRAALGHGLSREFGAELERDGTAFRVKGVPEGLEETFSTRRKQVLEQLDARGLDSPRAAETAALTTRERKGHVARSELFPQWGELGREHGLTSERADTILGGPSRALDQAPAGKLIRRTVGEGVGALLSQRTGFAERDLVRYVATELQAAGITVNGILGGVRTELTRLRELGHVQELGQENGYSVLTTRETLEREQSLLSTARTLAGQVTHAADEKSLEHGLRKAAQSGPELNEEQRRALRHLTQNSGDLACLQGLAGTGKTTLLRAARHTWEKAGYTVVGSALAGKAAIELEAGSGIKSDTLAMTLLSLREPTLGDAARHEARQFKRALQGKPRYELREPSLAPGQAQDPTLSGTLKHEAKQFGRALLGKGRTSAGPQKLTSKHVIVVDEASMVGLSDTQELLDQVKRSGAKLVLVGDRHQKPAIGEVGPFSALVEEHGAVELRGITRQHELWEREALTQVVEGDVRSALSQYGLQGRLHSGETSRDTRSKLVEDWSRDRTEDLSETLVLTSTNEERVDLNQRIQAVRLGEGELKPRTRTRSGLLDDIYVGDRVMLTSIDRTQGACNGDLGTVESLDQGGFGSAPTATVCLDRTRTRLGITSPIRVTVPLTREGGLELGYAVTGHKGQGATVQRAFVLETPDYTSLSRARERTDIYVTADTDSQNDLPQLVQRDLEQLLHQQESQRTLAVQHQQRLSPGM